MTLVAVTGGSGFIGRCLLETLAASGREVRALVRRPPERGTPTTHVQWVVGDVADGASWRKLLEPGCTLINLAHSQTAEISDAIEATQRMIDACADARIGKLVHCSTVSVYGRVKEPDIQEGSICNPLSEYGRIKLAIEEKLKLDSHCHFSLAILRPTVVFGLGGEALVKLVESLLGGSHAINYFRSSLFGDRRTNLVPVETVAAALTFLTDTSRDIAAETFIVSDDDHPLNNFRDVERILMAELNISDYPVSPIPVPRKVLEITMRLMGRINVDTRTKYRGDKLRDWGFVNPVRLEDALVRYAAEYLRARGRTFKR